MKTSTPLLTTIVLLLLVQASAAAEYDPLAVDKAKLPAPIDLTIEDAKRDREIPVRIYLPNLKDPAPVVLFSHGLGGSRMNNPYLGEHWAGRGYVVVFVQHPGSDESVWKGVRPREIMGKMRDAASADNFALRVKDIPAVLDQLKVWNAADTTQEGSDSSTKKLVGRMDLEHVGMSGHSFGAVTTQAVSGQAFVAGRTLADPRIDAAVMMSPSTPRAGSPDRAFGEVKLPWLLLTGTEDSSPIGDQTPESRLKVYPALPPGDKFQLVLDGADHSAFSHRARPRDRGNRNENHHRAILATSTAFWDTYLKEDGEAKKWIESGDQVRKILEPADTWEHK
ncbi:alpha/beta hydrolase family protein [Aeoliella sp. SH292]|uniref:alpha/beta hydrolase family protein n=1 Tax=Aeoliella sp. SH292 TaxID=3454464 RepID=UPI003F997CD4